MTLETLAKDIAAAAESDAEALIAEAKAEAKQLLADAESKATALREGELDHYPRRWNPSHLRFLDH